MIRNLPLFCLIAVGLAGCPKGGSGSRTPTSESVLADWTRTQLDLRAWRSCARAAIGLNLEDSEITFSVDAEGQVEGMKLLPAAQEADPGMICLAMELAHPPDMVPASGEAHTVRLPARSVHEVPGAGS